MVFCLKLIKKNQKILSCFTCWQTSNRNCVENKFCITKNMLQKYTFCSFTFPFSSYLDKEFTKLFVCNFNLFCSANQLNNSFKNLIKYNEHLIAYEGSCNGNEINFFHNVKDANSLLFNTFNKNSNFSVLYLNIRSLSNLKIFQNWKDYCHF